MALPTLALALLLALQQHALAAPPIVANPPHWSWATLGDMAFLHAGDPRPYSATELALVKRFPIVQFDKKQVRAAQPAGRRWLPSPPLIR